MTVESVTYISDFDATLPDGNDQKKEGAAHIRNIKKAWKQTFPNVTGEVSLSAGEFNYLTALAVNVEAKLDSLSVSVSGNNTRVDTLSANVASISAAISDKFSAISAYENSIYIGEIDVSATSLFLPVGWSSSYVSSGTYRIIFPDNGTSYGVAVNSTLTGPRIAIIDTAATYIEYNSVIISTGSLTNAPTNFLLKYQ